MGIEPTLSAWEAEVLPLNYTRVMKISEMTTSLIRVLVCKPIVAYNEPRHLKCRAQIQ